MLQSTDLHFTMAVCGKCDIMNHKSIYLRNNTYITFHNKEIQVIFKHTLA